jgi:hypothetical protein
VVNTEEVKIMAKKKIKGKKKRETKEKKGK